MPQLAVFLHMVTVDLVGVHAQYKSLQRRFIEWGQKNLLQI